MFMKKNVVILISLVILYACEEIHDPEIFPIESYSFFANGEDQISEAGNYLSEDIGLKMIGDNFVNNNPNEFNVQFEVIKGDGTISSFDERFNENGMAFANWELGSKSCEQIIRASVFKESGEKINETSFRAFGLRNDIWNEIPVHPHRSIDDVVYDTVNQNTFMISSGNMYRQGEKYYQWEMMPTGLTSLRTIEFDKNGILYAGTWQGKLYKSFDKGVSWIACTNPIKDRNYYFEFYITSDNCLWATAWDHGLHYSNDGGSTWYKDSLGIENQEEMLDVYKFKNGTLVSLSRNKLLILKSEDGGKVWESINTPQYTIKIYVTENDELIAINQDNGITMYKSEDLGQSYREVLNVYPSWGTSPMEHNFQKYKGVCYVAIPGFGVLTTKDFETFTNHSRSYTLRELFIDHNGVLIAKDWESKSVSYRKDSEN